MATAVESIRSKVRSEQRLSFQLAGLFAGPHLFADIGGVPFSQSEFWGFWNPGWSNGETRAFHSRPVSERSPLLSAIVQGESLAFSAGLRLRNLDQTMVRRERADWIGGAGIPGHKKSLAATTAKVNRAALTVSAGF